MNISTELLTWNASTNTFIAEASDLKLGEVPKSVMIWNPKTMGSILVFLQSIDESDGDIMGWRFKSHQGYNLIIIND